MRSYDTKKPFEGVITNLDRRYRETESEWAREELAKYFSDIPCDGCHGYRLKPEALCVKIGGKHIGEISRTVGAPRRRMVRDRAEGAQRPAERDRRRAC